MHQSCVVADIINDFLKVDRNVIIFKEQDLYKRYKTSTPIHWTSST